MKLTSKGKGLGTSTKSKLNNFSFEYGTLNQSKCTGIYINCISYVIPNDNYKDNVLRFKYDFGRYISSYVSNRFIIELDYVLVNVDERTTDNCNRNDVSSTILPIEVTIKFINKLIYKELKDDIEVFMKLMVKYFESYKGMSIEPQRNTNFNKKD